VMVSVKRVLLPARASGKVKAWIYAFAGIGGIVSFSLGRLGWFPESRDAVHVGALALFLLAAAVAVWSLVDYAVFFVKNFGKSS